MSIHYYKDGIPCECDEMRLDHYFSGVVWSETPVVNGVSHGTRREYYRTGALFSEAFFENGQLHGIAKEYSDDGMLRFQYIYAHKKHCTLLHRKCCPMENFM
jgi:antitoxin component YwqK of YwqJK toxin-antitoxin module